MAVYTVYDAAPVGFTPAQFFPPTNNTLDSFNANQIILRQASGRYVVLSGNGIVMSGLPGEEAPTAGTITAIMLYASDFATQIAGFGSLNVAAADIAATWTEVSTPESVYAFLLAGNDTVNGSVQADTLLGGDGNDTIAGGADGDTIDAGAGNDTIEPGDGSDTINGGAGQDRVRYSNEIGTGITANLATGQVTDPYGATDTLTGIEAVIGTNQADTLVGGNAALPNNNVWELYGLGGDDTLVAGTYDSLLQPGGGTDTITGGAGSDQITYEEYTGANGATINLATGVVLDPYGFTDTITGGVEGVRRTKNADTITGKSGNDYLRGIADDDAIDGGDGTDQVRYDRDAAAGGTAGVTVNLATGKATDGFGNTDTLTSIENVRGTAKADTLTGNGSNNAFQGLGGADTLNGGAGQDTADYSADTLGAGITGVTVNLATGTATDGSGATDTLVSIEAARGTAGNDSLTGGSVAISGQAYELYGGAGNDQLFSGGYDIYVEPGAGNDTITAGAGFDQVSYGEYSGANGATIDLATGVVNDPYGGTDTLVGLFEGARGTRNADTITGNTLNNQFRGLAGNDTIDGGSGQDRVRYDRDATYGGTKGVVVDLGSGTATDGFGNTDTLVSIEQVEGTSTGDTLTGGNGPLPSGTSYELLGRGGDDTLIGGTASTYFEAGAGNDTITGNSTADQISYADFTNGVGITLDMAKGSVIDPLGGTDTFTGIEFVRGTNFADAITGDDLDNQIAGLNGNDTLSGGGGVDLVRYDRDTNYGGKAGVTVNLATGTATDGFGATDTLSGFENIRGSFADDSLTGDDANNLIQGMNGADTIDGAGGIDTVDYSRDGADGGTAGVVVNLATGKATDGFGATDTLTSIENATGTALADTLTGSDADNALRGGLGDDTIVGGLGNDTIDGGGGADTAIFSGTRAEYEIRFDAGTNALVVLGPDGVDTLSDVENLQFADRTVEALANGAPQHLVSSTFPVSATNPTEASRFMLGSSYSGPVSGLSDEFVFPTPENINIASTLPSAFIRTGAGNDAITVFNGRNVIDAFTGSNFLTGGSGHDTFFVDARGGGSTWDTIVNFGVGDEVTLWGYVDGVSKDGLDKATWYASDGVDPFKGLTIHAKLDGVNFGSSITFAGLGLADRDSLLVTTGNVAGNDYLYITRV